MKATKPPSGRTIVLELLREMEDRLYPLLYRTLAPSVYHVYMHPDDFREIEHITSLIVADAKQGLTARIESLNRRSLLTSLIAGKQPPVEIPPGGWEVHLQPDVNGELQPRELGIESRLSVPPPPSFVGGTATTRIGRTVVTGTVRRSTVSNEPSVALATATHAAGATITEHRPPSAGASDSTTPRGVARLSYVDDDGPHVFVMRKDTVSIGRGGTDYGVDVQIVAGPRVSREHCHIRRGADGRYFLRDSSTWGTSVDGRRLPTTMPPDGTRLAAAAPSGLAALNAEQELPSRARIQLADTVVIEFEASQP